MNNKNNSEEYQVRKQMTKINLGFRDHEIYEDDQKIIDNGPLNLCRKHIILSHPVINEVLKNGFVKGSMV